MKISVAMTTYNGEKYILELLSSLVNQKTSIDEIIICDDNSTDNTVNYIKSCIAQHSVNNIKLYENHINLGWKKNFRKAMNLCTGDYIFLCDQDDIWLPNKVTMMVDIMEKNPDISLLVSNFIFFTEKGTHFRSKGIKNQTNDGGIEKLEFKRWHFTVIRPGCTFCVRKGLVEEVNRYDDPEVDHDYVLWGAAILKDELWLLRKQLIKFRRHNDSVTTRDSDFTKENKEKGILNLLKCLYWANEYGNRYINDKDKLLELKAYTRFTEKRKEIMINGSVADMFKCVIKHKRLYPTKRNALSDVMIKIKEALLG